MFSRVTCRRNILAIFSFGLSFTSISYHLMFTEKTILLILVLTCHSIKRIGKRVKASRLGLEVTTV